MGGRDDHVVAPRTMTLGIPLETSYDAMNAPPVAFRPMDVYSPTSPSPGMGSSTHAVPFQDSWFGFPRIAAVPVVSPLYAANPVTEPSSERRARTSSVGTKFPGSRRMNNVPSFVPPYTSQSGV